MLGPYLVNKIGNRTKQYYNTLLTYNVFYVFYLSFIVFLISHYTINIKRTILRILNKVALDILQFIGTQPLTLSSV